MSAPGVSIVVSGLRQLVGRIARDYRRGDRGGRAVTRLDLELSERVLALDVVASLGAPPARWTRSARSARSAVADEALAEARRLAQRVLAEPWAHSQASTLLADTLVRLDAAIVASRGAELPSEWAPQEASPVVAGVLGRSARGGAPS